MTTRNKVRTDAEISDEIRRLDTQMSVELEAAVSAAREAVRRKHETRREQLYNELVGSHGEAMTDKEGEALLLRYARAGLGERAISGPYLKRLQVYVERRYSGDVPCPSVDFLCLRAMGLKDCPCPQC